MTDEMLQKARKNANDNGYTNVEFRKGDIERKIPVEDNAADLVISNCVINLTADKEVNRDSIDPEKWCSCIDGALTKKNYLDSIRGVGFQTVEVLDEEPY